MDAPLRIKTLHNITDAKGNAQRSTDGLDFSVPTTEYPLVGSTEQWDILNIGGGSHQVHLHLIEFQVVSRQTINTAAYLRAWQLMNGQRPVTRPIVVDPTPYLTGPVVPALPYETGWKDTVRAPGNQLTRIIARWAPQELAAAAVTPGQNLFSIDPTTGPGYVWHCHILGHEDNDMMRPMQLVNSWAAPVVYPAGKVVTYQNVNYRIRLPHTSLTAQPPPSRFDRYERVNNNDGTWQPQIVYAVADRVLHLGQLYMSDAVHQAQVGQTPDITPTLWHAFPMTGCGQLQELCHDSTSPAGLSCHNLGHAGAEPACLGQLTTCLSACSGGAHAHSGSPCSGLCASPVSVDILSMRPDASQGRWGGRLTSRPLPEHDAEISALTDAQRDELGRVWLGRAASERRVADAFEVIRDALAQRGSAAELVSLAARAVDDEYRHAELSLVVASRFAGRELSAPPRLSLVVPEHRGAPARLVPSLHILGHCAMNETFASAFLEASLEPASAPLARAALRELLSDEIDHARIGWAHISELSSRERAELAPWLDSLVHANLKMWRTAPRPYTTDAELHRHGAPPAEVVERALLGAVRELIIPGLAHFGLPTRSLESWLGSGAPTN